MHIYSYKSIVITLLWGLMYSSMWHWIDLCFTECTE